MIPSVRELYNQLIEKRNEITAFTGVEMLLLWDQNVSMPRKAATQRGQQSAAVAGASHDRKTCSQLGNILEQLQALDLSELTEMERAVVRDSKRDYQIETAVPRDLATKIAKLKSEAQSAWVQAREKEDFSIFAPFLQSWLDMLREKAKHIDPTRPVFEVLMDQFERGITMKKLDSVFDQLKKGLIPLLEKIQSQPEPDTSFLNHEFDVSIQAKISAQIAKELGFDLERGKIDVSVHPFTAPVAPINDIRFTSRYNTKDLAVGIKATIHETGHSLYEQGLDPLFGGLPGGVAVSMGVHESQSLFWERMVGMNLPFWKKYWPLIQESFPSIPKETTYEQFHKALNIVSRGKIRVEANELAYPLHIIIRYEIEQGLINGDIKVDDNLPLLWNQKMKEYLGVTIDNLKEGILQDIHWSIGYIGFFPTYTLGAIYASQFYKTALEKIPNLEKQIEEGNFAELLKWLNNKYIHLKGSLYPGGDLLCREVTGEELDASIFLNYLSDKYLKLYSL